MDKEYYHKGLLFVMLLSLFCSCENTDPGCLDLRAENFDVFAVSECDSCCVYPASNINVAFEYVLADSTYAFAFNNLYPYEGVDSIVVSDFQLPMSNFTFYAAGQPYYILDTIRGQDPRIYDDYVLKEKSSADIEIGKTIFVEDVDSVMFYVGLVESTALALRPYEDIDQDSRFINVIDEMYVDSISRLFQARIELTIEDSLRELELLDIENPNLVFTVSESLSPGIEWTIPLIIDMRMLLDGIKPDDTNEVMAATISRNISKSFSN